MCIFFIKNTLVIDSEVPSYLIVSSSTTDEILTINNLNMQACRGSLW